MSDRIQSSWKVLKSIEIDTGDFCVDIFVREDGSYGFEEFRKDSEDMGKWTGLKYFSVHHFSSEHEALSAAKKNIFWLNELFG